MPVNITCCVCGTPFGIVPARLKKARYCSLPCRNEGIRLPVDPPKISEDGLTARIPLYKQGRVDGFAVVDASDAALVSQYRWRLNTSGYPSRSQWDGTRNRAITMHREVLGLIRGDGLEGEHQNRVKIDNRRANLRIVPKGVNQQNVPSYRGSTSPYRGVCWSKSTSKWQANVQVNRKMHYLGVFSDELEAARVAREARARLMPYATD